MVVASAECSATLRFQRFLRRESFAPREENPLAVLTQAAKAADEALLAGSFY